MADQQTKQSARRRKQPETVRELAQKEHTKRAKPKKQRTNVLARPFGWLGNKGSHEFHPIKLPDNKLGRFLTKRRSLLPNYIRQSWQELKKVTWPDRRETVHLTFAVFLFAIFFTALVQLINMGFEKLFREIIL